MYEVRDGNRVLRFDGALLAESSSRRSDTDRWVEFQLGQTTLFHALDCAIVKRNHLKPSGIEFLTDEHLACEECDPEDDLEEIAIEKPRYFALISESPEAILEALYKYDHRGARYLTHVAQRLIETACETDARLEKAYRVEYIH